SASCCARPRRRRCPSATSGRGESSPVPRRLSHSRRLDYSAGAVNRHGQHEGEVLSIMTEFSFSRRRRLMVPALSVTAALAGALLCAGGPVAAEDAANPNVIVDDSALDGPAGANGSGSELLPAPAHQPMSRLVTAGQSAVEAATPPQKTSETTFSAVPTTPIESTGLDGSE